LPASDDPAAYQAVLARRSVRRFDAKPLDRPALDAIRQATIDAWPLSWDVQIDWRLRDCSPAASLSTMIGGYGKLLSPPHFLTPAATAYRDERQALVELGFRAEQVGVRLAALGLGSCFVGALSGGESALASLGLAAPTVVAAVLAFGRPSVALGGRVTNQLMRVVTGATNKLAADRVFFADDFAHPATPPVRLAPLVEAARNAPSSYDAQPWRLLGVGGSLYLYVRRQTPRYGGGRGQLYRYHDGGACLANVALAAAALGIAGSCALLDPADPTLPSCPDDLEPLAAFRQAAP
jgi:nitroreductase